LPCWRGAQPRATSSNRRTTTRRRGLLTHAAVGDRVRPAAAHGRGRRRHRGVGRLLVVVRCRRDTLVAAHQAPAQARPAVQALLPMYVCATRSWFVSPVSLAIAARSRASSSSASAVSASFLTGRLTRLQLFRGNLPA
jgi:hypothetical protein